MKLGVSVAMWLSAGAGFAQNLSCDLREYKPLLKEFWREGLFEDLDRRYFRLVNRAPTLDKEINWELLGDYEPFESRIRVRMRALEDSA